MTINNNIKKDRKLKILKNEIDVASINIKEKFQ
jgi:hypothetical protein